VLEWYFRVKVRLEKYYQPMHELVPRQGRIYDVGCGYGFLSYMLAFLSAERQVTGIDYDAQKTGLAAHCNDDTPNVSFYASDALTYPYEPADAFLINDVLHYMPKAAQAALIDRCLGKLNPGGVLIIRDADASLQKRHQGTRISELFSVKLLGFNKSASRQLHFISSQEMLDILLPYGVTVEIINRTRFNSNVIYYIKKPPVAADVTLREKETTRNLNNTIIQLR
jgi:trans-aconitate methyltransferase